MVSRKMLQSMSAVSLQPTKFRSLLFTNTHFHKKYQAFKNCSLTKHKSGFHLSSMKPVVCSGFHLSSMKPVEKQSLIQLVPMHLRLSIKACKQASNVCWNARYFSWVLGTAFIGACLSFSTRNPVCAEAYMGNNIKQEVYGSSPVSSHGKKVYRDYSVTGIPGDGRCLFRSVIHGACLRSGKPLPDVALQRELADELRAKVADEFIMRREDTEWFIEGDFNSYISQIRKPHVWGGEPELLMASHVLRMPITVYMHDDDSGGLISIAEYGQEYGKEDPVQVLYHGFGHYDALQIPGKKDICYRI